MRERSSAYAFAAPGGLAWLGVEDEVEEALVFLLAAVVVVARTEKRRTARQGPAGSAARVGGPVLRTGTARYSTRTFRLGFSKRLPFRCWVRSVLCGFPGDFFPRERRGRSVTPSVSGVECPGGQLRVHGECVL